MRKELLPGEQVLTVTRQQPRSLFFPVLVLILIPAVAGYASAWIAKGNPQRLMPFITSAWTPWLMGACVGLAALVILAYSVKRFLRWRSLRYILTSRRIIAKHGMLRRGDWQVPLMSVRNVGIQQSLLQRTLHSGNISLDTGHSGMTILADVPEVGKFRGFIIDALEDLPRDGVLEGEVLPDFDDVPWEVREGGRDER
ncbi:PH domain-containing protein [Paenarthrobacter sp. NPDC058040]|uniref:PH domain-containing protein n=1 Tax=unclassified Paenarthrobacter TaxID=2634190 RepID=UPI0036DB8AF1